MKDGRYNFIFNALVDDEDDILGQLAYSVYKRQKIEYIQAFRDRNDTTSATAARSLRPTGSKRLG
jgi:hypothetical protein